MPFLNHKKTKKDLLMRIINGASFRKRLAEHMNECEESSIPVLVCTSKDGRKDPQQMIVISKAQYDMMIDKINGDKL